MIQYTISPEAEKCDSGVYMILFSDGTFYIGSSSSLQRRIRQHIRCLNVSLTNSATPKTLSKMAGFTGSAEILLLESVEPQFNVNPNNNRIAKNVIAREIFYINKYNGHPLMLNKAKKSISHIEAIAHLGRFIKNDANFRLEMKGYIEKIITTRLGLLNIADRAITISSDNISNDIIAMFDEGKWQ